MAFPRPPLRREELGPASVGGVAQRVKAQETPVLPEPRTYYVTSSSTFTTAGATVLDLINIPVFWRPGNLIGIMVTADIRWNTSASGGSVTMSGSPFQGTTAVPLFTLPALTNAYAKWSSDTNNPQGAAIGLSVLTPYFGGFLYQTSYTGQTVDTSAGVKTLALKIARTSGTGTISAQNIQAWVQVF